MSKTNKHYKKKSLIEAFAKVCQPVPKLCKEAFFFKKINYGLMYIAQFSEKKPNYPKRYIKGMQKCGQDF